MATEAFADLEAAIGNLADIEANVTLKSAYTRWQNLQPKLDERITYHRSQVNNVTNEIYQLLGFLSAFQGLLLTAVAQASQLKCHNVGIPLALSLFATVITLAGVCQKKRIISEFDATLSQGTRAQQANRIRLRKLENEGKNFNNPPAAQDQSTAGRCPPWVNYNNGVLVCIVLLGGICSLFIYRVLCDA